MMVIAFIVAVPAVRRFVLRVWELLIAPHRVRAGLVQAGVADRRGFLPWAYMKMWKGPRHTDERVENKYAGRIIQ